MAVVDPIAKEKAAQDVQAIYDNLAQVYGRMPNIFAVMAHRPAVLQNFLPLYTAVMTKGTIERKYKELAYLKTDLLNGCEY